MASRKDVSGTVVRAFLTSEAGQAALKAHADALTAAGKAPAKDITIVGGRGRFSQDQIDVFHKQNKRERYAPNHVESRKITGERVDSNGRKRKVTVTATLGEVRAWASSPEGIAAGVKVGARGRVSSATMAAFAARPVSPVTTVAATNVTDVTA